MRRYREGAASHGIMSDEQLDLDDKSDEHAKRAKTCSPACCRHKHSEKAGEDLLQKAKKAKTSSHACWSHKHSENAGGNLLQDAKKVFAAGRAVLVVAKTFLAFLALSLCLQMSRHTC